MSVEHQYEHFGYQNIRVKVWGSVCLLDIVCLKEMWTVLQNLHPHNLAAYQWAKVGCGSAFELGCTRKVYEMEAAQAATPGPNSPPSLHPSTQPAPAASPPAAGEPQRARVSVITEHLPSHWTSVTPKRSFYFRGSIVLTLETRVHCSEDLQCPTGHSKLLA